MKAKENTKLLIDVAKTCLEFEPLLPETVGYDLEEGDGDCRVFFYSKHHAEDSDLFFTIDQDLDRWIQENAIMTWEHCQNVIQHSQNLPDCAPTFVCVEIGDCKRAFEFLSKNYLPWQNHKLRKRETNRMGHPLQKHDPAAEGGAL